MTQFNGEPQAAGGLGSPEGQQPSTNPSPQQAPGQQPYGQNAPVTQFGQPQQGQQPQQPQQPQYGQPAQQPQQPQFGQPAQPIQPAQPVQQPQFGQPVQPSQPQYAQPQQPQYAQPQAQQPQFGQPGQYPAGQPSIPQMPPTYAGAMGPSGEPAFNQPWYGINFVNACKRFFTKYADFTGRASRGEFWWAVLLLVLVSFAITVITSPMGSFGDYLSYVWDLATIVPMLAVTTRRVHDENMSGWWTALPAGLSYGGYAVMMAVYKSLDPELIITQDYNAIGQSTLMTMGWGTIFFMAGMITWLVFGLRQSNPMGARFDKVDQSQMPMQ